MTMRAMAAAFLGASLFLGPALFSGPALAVDVRTPWADVFVGPGGVYVNGPWGRVNVPDTERDRVCAKWRRSTLDHYNERGCTVTFDDDGCVIDNVDCPEK